MSLPTLRMVNARFCMESSALESYHRARPRTQNGLETTAPIQRTGRGPIMKLNYGARNPTAPVAGRFKIQIRYFKLCSIRFCTPE